METTGILCMLIQSAPDPEIAVNRQKFAQLEDTYNKRWQSIVHFGRQVTADESRLAGWYKSEMTIGPEPNPIPTGATIHLLCVTLGPLRTYKLFVRVYGGRSDGNLETKHQNTATLQKWVILYNTMLCSFKGAGRCVTMDSAYMEHVMALIGRHEWKTNMIGTTQEN